MDDIQTVKVYDSKIDEYVRLIDRPPEKSLIDFTGRICRSGFVLDLGCGPGKSAAFMRSRGLKVDAVDGSSKMVEMANSKYGLGARQLCFHEISGKNIYDGVWANFSLLHAKKENFPNYLALIFRVLKTKGVLSIGMKLGAGEVRDNLGRLYAYYSRAELMNSLLHCGFVLEDEYSGEEKGLAGTTEPWIVVRVRK